MDVVANLITIIGLPLTLLGLAFSYQQLRKTASSAEAARQAIETFRREQMKMDVVAEMSSALDCLEHIKGLLRAEDYRVLPEQLQRARLSLIIVKDSGIIITPEQHRLFQSVISSLNDFESQFDSKTEESDFAMKVPSILKTISQHGDNLAGEMVRMRKKLEDSFDGR